jgi:hypothetical protein
MNHYHIDGTDIYSPGIVALKRRNGERVARRSIGTIPSILAATALPLPLVSCWI